MRSFSREEIKIVRYSADTTPDPPDSTFVTLVPLVNNDDIFNIIDNHKGLTENQRYKFFKNF